MRSNWPEIHFLFELVSTKTVKRKKEKTLENRCSDKGTEREQGAVVVSEGGRGRKVSGSSFEKPYRSSESANPIKLTYTH